MGPRWSSWARAQLSRECGCLTQNYQLGLVAPPTGPSFSPLSCHSYTAGRWCPHCSGPRALLQPQPRSCWSSGPTYPKRTGAPVNLAGRARRGQNATDSRCSDPKSNSKNREQAPLLPGRGRINKLWCVCTMKRYPVLRKCNKTTVNKGKRRTTHSHTGKSPESAERRKPGT